MSDPAELETVTGDDPRLRDVQESWPVVASHDVHRDGWVVALRADQVTGPGEHSGEPFRRLVLEHPGAVVVLAIDDQDRVLCLRQYRHPARTRFVELPAGLLDGPAGEDPLEVARRELREEAQLAAREWSHLVSAWSSPGLSSELIHYYVARGLSPMGRGDFEMLHEEAHLELFWVPFDDLLAAILDGRVGDAPLQVAVLAYDARRRRGGSPAEVLG